MPTVAADGCGGVGSVSIGNGCRGKQGSRRAECMGVGNRITGTHRAGGGRRAVAPCSGGGEGGSVAKIIVREIGDDARPWHAGFGRNGYAAGADDCIGHDNVEIGGGCFSKRAAGFLREDLRRIGSRRQGRQTAGDERITAAAARGERERIGRVVERDRRGQIGGNTVRPGAVGQAAQDAGE